LISLVTGAERRLTPSSSSEKKGKADLSHGLFLTALHASTKNIPFLGSFTKKIKGRERKPGIRKRVRRKLVKLLVIAWALTNKKEVFHPDRIRQKEECRRETPAPTRSGI
jgi:hypothetical protein